MKKAELFEKYADRIRKEMREDYRLALMSWGEIEYDIYLWEDGDVEYLVRTKGENSWLQPKQGEERKLFLVTTISVDNYNIYDIPTDEDIDEMTKEQKDALVSEYIEEMYQAYLDEQEADDWYQILSEAEEK